MPKRSREPEEAFGPAIDGNAQIARLEMAMRPAPEPEPAEEEQPLPEPEMTPTALICGSGDIAYSCAKLAKECGFRIELIEKTAIDTTLPLAQLAENIIESPDFDDIVEKCTIDASYYVCVFTENPSDCEHILYQCLASNAAYIGAWANTELRKQIFENLKEDGAPDAELAAICCPMGLGIGSRTPEQDAVSIVAELLAARSGVLKRLRLANKKA